MATVDDSQPTSLSQRGTTAPSNKLNVTTVRDSENNQVSPHDGDEMSLGRPPEDH